MTEQSTLPFEPTSSFKLATRKNLDNLNRMGRGYYLVPVRNMGPREQLNPREDFEEIVELSHKLEKYGQRMPCLVDALEDGNFLINDGERRWRAMMLLQEKSKKDLYLFCIINSRETTDIERYINTFITQDNKQLKPFELAKWVATIAASGMPQKEIAALMGKSDAYVSQLLSFSKESPEIKDLVKAGKTNVSEVVKLQHKVPDQQERLDVILSAIEKNVHPTSLLAAANRETDMVGTSPDDDYTNATNEKLDKGSNMEAGEQIDRNANYKSSSQPQLDDIDNASGPAHRLPKNNSSNGEQRGNMTKRDKLQACAQAVSEKYDLSLDEDELIELFNLLCEYQ